MEIHIPQMSIGGGDNQCDAQTYRVQPGDTLESIAARFAMELGELISANFKEGYGGQLRAGQELRIPIGDNVRGFILYTVREGDTPDKIATEFNIGLTDLFRANPQLVNNHLLPGSTLKVPQFAASANADNQLPQTYTMKLGDSLAEIAKRFNLPARELQQSNPQIADPNRSYPGMVVKFPRMQAGSEATSRHGGTSNASPAGTFALDNLSKIRFQMMEAQRTSMPVQTPVPGFGNPAQIADEGEGSEPPVQRRKGKASIPPPFDEWAPFIYAAAEKYQIEASLIAAIIWRESGGNNIINGHGHGLMQIDDRRYGDWLGQHQQGLDPASNIDFGSSILRSCLDRFSGEQKAALAAYSAGVDNFALDVLVQQEYFKRFFDD